jgi:hypothetical protein
MSEPEDKGSTEPAQLQVGAAAAPSGEGHRTPEREPRKEEEGPSRGGSCNGSPPTEEKPRRRRLRKKRTRNQDEDWESVRRDVWLREMLTDSSENEPEDKYMRFKESSRWIADKPGIENKANLGQKGPAKVQT